jgi:putative transposase
MESPRFIHEFELAPTPHQARILRVRLELGRQMYNAMLGKARARFNRCRRLHAWQQARPLFAQARTRARQHDAAGAKALRRDANALQQVAIRQVMREERARYSPGSVGKADRLKDPAPAIMTRLRQAHFRAHLDFKSVQGLATRAYQTMDQLRFRRPTRRDGKGLKFPRAHFLRYDEARAIDSTSIHWRGDHIEWNSPAAKLRIPVLFDAHDPKGIQAHALAHLADPALICESLRVLARTIRGHERWYVQVTLKGQARWKEAQYPPGHGQRVGIDFGVSAIGICWTEQAREGMEEESKDTSPRRDGKSAIGVCWQGPDGNMHGAKVELAAGLRHDYARIRALQRYLDRSRRATNPDNYHPDGTIKRTPGQRLLWHQSQRYRQAQAHLADLWRRYAAHRKNLLGRLANTILTHGTTVQMEDVSYKSWQQQWGKSIGRGAPGMLVRLLTQKAEALGGQVRVFGTRQTKFSQLCHGCNTYTKKRLKDRTHKCACGIGPLDRDIYSAFLAYHYDFASTTLDIGAARAAFAALLCGAEDVLGHDQVASVRLTLGAPTPKGMGAQSDPSAHRALAYAEAGADPHAPERRAATPTFVGSALSIPSASITAGIPAPGDPRMAFNQDTGAA